jgi:hypothetical protein
MNKQLENIKQCTTCFSTHLEYLPSFEHEDIELNTIDETVMRIDDVVRCVDCDTLYYLEKNGKMCKEYSYNSNPFRDKKLNYVSDYEVAKNKQYEKV